MIVSFAFEHIFEEPSDEPSTAKKDEEQKLSMKLRFFLFVFFILLHQMFAFHLIDFRVKNNNDFEVIMA